MSESFQRFLAGAEPSARELAELVVSLDAVIYELDRAGRFVRVWATDESRLYAPRDRFIGKTIREVLGPQDAPHFEQLLAKVLLDGKEHLLTFPEPKLPGKWSVARATPIRRLGEGEGAAHVLVTVKDVTAAHQDHVSARQQAAFIQAVANAMPAALSVYSLEELRYQFVNNRLSEFLGYSADELQDLGLRLFTELVHPDDQTAIATLLQSLSGLKEGDVVPLEYRIRHKAGHWLWFKERTMSFRRDAQGVPIEILSVTENVTDLKAAQEQLESERVKSIHSSKMATLGEMMGGIAHEIASPLAVITTLASQLAELAEDGELEASMIKDHSQTIEKTAARVGKIIRSMRSFARDAEADPFERTQVGRIVEDTLLFCKERYQKLNVELRIQPFDPAIEIECRATEISQVVLNLLNNARDAIEERPKPWVELAVMDLGASVEFWVTDCGPGLPPAVAAKLFQPFFTTKPPGKGTGLGLGISRRIASAHQGELTVDPKVPNTRFVLRLPKSQTPVGLQAGGGS